MTQITVIWKASEKLQKQEFIKTGERPDASRKLQLDLVEQLTQEQRKVIVEHLGLYCFTLDMRATHDFNKKMPASSYLPAFRQGCDRKPTLSDILSYVAQEADARNEAQVHKAKVNAAKKANQEQLQTVYDKLRPQVDARIEFGDLDALEAFSLPVKAIANFKPSGGRVTLSKLLSDAIKDASKAKREADKSTWIAAHGSDYLKRVHDGGYDAQRLYVTERAAAEAPEFVVDFDKGAVWGDRTCPAIAALDAETEAKKLSIGEDVKVVWLRRAAVNSVRDEGDWPPDDFEECEAVVIRNYLGKYDLVREL